MRIATADLREGSQGAPPASAARTQPTGGDWTAAIVAERSRGLTPLQAAREAAVERFRPIMMTTLAAMFGALPLAIATGAGAELRRPLGITIVGGLLLSQILTLYTTPVIYLLMAKLSSKRARVVAPEPAPAE